MVNGEVVQHEIVIGDLIIIRYKAGEFMNDGSSMHNALGPARCA